jgi:hypothetical protein
VILHRGSCRLVSWNHYISIKFTKTQIWNFSTMLAHILNIDHVDMLDNIIANTDFMIC